MFIEDTSFCAEIKELVDNCNALEMGYPAAMAEHADPGGLRIRKHPQPFLIHGVPVAAVTEIELHLDNVLHAAASMMARILATY
ncbi:hypothetical protein OHD62_03815 [Mesorhizobium sp. YC-39]|uniref:hypothetical protein n=1 Tax=unclassified Mesorhizobium TaxID=325217 RepID=UPI0021E70D19|nr:MULTISPECIES: hypothetical protein [unclassified Mesorhizobium]MCV3206110.1 hypothetical protein [Mesorhizobium sp. YC-2]MCV3227490.1 hypothetical protein [Mesorhizobium sp. YC-39]